MNKKDKEEIRYKFLSLLDSANVMVELKREKGKDVIIIKVGATNKIQLLDALANTLKKLAQEKIAVIKIKGIKETPLPLVDYKMYKVTLTVQTD